jgi:hypothetical protein
MYVAWPDILALNGFQNSINVNNYIADMHSD